MNLYITADQAGTQTGGGIVTYHELEAMRSIGETQLMDRSVLALLVSQTRIDGRGEDQKFQLQEPWIWDHCARCEVQRRALPYNYYGNLKLAHVYAGTFTETVSELQDMGVKVTYTAAAHDIDVSRREHEALGIPYNYPHLTDPRLWQRYVGGYRSALVVVCPSYHSADCMRSYGCQNIVVIPHGVTLPERISPLPKRFTVGYLGAYGPDKGVRYLLRAWKQLDLADATLVLAGRDSVSPFIRDLVSREGGGNVELRGWIGNVSEFYSSLSLYVQPSCTEGFGIEVLEAMVHGRLVLCSTGAGAADTVSPAFRFLPGQPRQLAGAIRAARDTDLTREGVVCRGLAENYTWDKICARYVALWRSLA